MSILQLFNMILTVDFSAGQVASLVIGGKERVAAPTALFRLRLRDKAGADYIKTIRGLGYRLENHG